MASILTLNDYCLLEIFSYLDFFDLHNLEQVDEKFQEIAEITYKSWRTLDFQSLVLKNINSRYRINHNVFKLMAKKAGPYVKSLIYTPRNREDFNAVIKYCPNVEHLETNGVIDMFQTSEDYARGIFDNLKSVTILSCNLNDWIGGFICKARELESLSLICCEISGSWFTRLQNLRIFNINYGSDIFRNLFQDFCKSCVSLEELYISGRINATCISAISMNLKNLRKLQVEITEDRSVRDYDEDKVITHLPQLTHLSIFDHGKADENRIALNLLQLADGEILEYLEILSTLRKDPNFWPLLHRFVVTFHKVKYLSLENLRNQLSDQFLFELPYFDALEDVTLYAVCLTDDGVCKLIRKCKSLKKLKLCSALKITKKLVLKVAPHLQDRSQILIIAMDNYVINPFICENFKNIQVTFNDE